MGGTPSNGNQLEKTAESSFDPWGVKLSVGVTNAVQNRWEMQGHEKENTFGLNRIDFGARTANPLTVVWDRVDIKAEKYNSFSPYNYVLNNPLKFIDPDGKEIILDDLFRKDKKGNYVNKEMVNAYNHFANSKIGREYLSNFAKKGQEIGGIKVSENGKFHNAKIDIAFRGSEYVENKRASGETGVSQKNNRFILNIDLKPVTNDSRRDADVETITHESFIHARRAANDFYDDGLINQSVGYDKDLVKHSKKYGFEHLDHWQEKRDRAYENFAYPIMRTYKNDYIKGLTKSQLINELYQFED